MATLADCLICRCIAEPLTRYGRHFGRTIHELFNVQSLVVSGLLRLRELADGLVESFSSEYVLSTFFFLLYLPWPKVLNVAILQTQAPVLHV